jgi:hypothetical protein
MTIYTKTELSKIARQAVRDAKKDAPADNKKVRFQYAGWNLILSEGTATLRALYNQTNGDKIEQASINIAI